MRISIVGPVYPYRGGIAEFTTSYALELIAAGHSVQVISFARQYPRWLYPGQSDRDPGSQRRHLTALYSLDPVYPWTWQKAVRQIVDFQPDFVMIQWWTTFWSPAFYALSAALNSRKIPCVFCIHNVLPHEERLPDVWITRRVLSRGNAFLTLSPKETNRLTRLLPEARIFTARLPVPEVALPVLDKESARTALGLDCAQPVLLAFGIVRPYKGLHVLLDALGLLKQEHITPSLVIAGEFWDDVTKYQAKINQFGIGDQVKVINRYLPVEELPVLFAAADGFVAPYLQGTQSAAIKMAIAYHLPILASSQIAGDLPLDSHPILVHQAGDARSLAESIQKFLLSDIPTASITQLDSGWQNLLAVADQIKNNFCQ